jgi:hypothetical protein
VADYLLGSVELDHPGSWWSVFGGRFFTKDGELGVGKFFIAAVVAAIGNEFLNGDKVVLWGFLRIRFLVEEEAGWVEMDVGQG